MINAFCNEELAAILLFDRFISAYLSSVSAVGVIWCSVRAKLHYTDTSYKHRWLRTSATNTTNRRAHNNSTTICHIAMPEPNISTRQDVGMWQIFVRWWCSLVVFVAGVRSRCPCSGVWHYIIRLLSRSTQVSVASSGTPQTSEKWIQRDVTTYAAFSSKSQLWIGIKCLVYGSTSMAKRWQLI